MSQLKLSININNKKPIELNELTNSLNALSKEYDDYCKNILDLPKNDRRLEIIKLEQGSLYLELVPFISLLFQEINPVLCFGKYIIEALEFFIKNSNKKDAPVNYTKKNCDNMSEFVGISANDTDSSILVSVKGDNNTIIVQQKIDSLESNAAQNNIAKFKDQLLEEEPIMQHKQALYWAIASFSKNSKGENSDKGFIERLDFKPHKIIFDNENDRHNITKFNEKYKKDWQDLIYIVDVEAIKIQDVIKTYKIIKVYYDDTINPDET